MKLMIASDIHGSAYYCEEMLKAFYREEADKLILLGDILYHGPRNDLPKEYAPKKVIDFLNNIKNKILCIRGNCDTEVDQMVLAFPILADYSALFFEKNMIYLSHGHHFNPDNLPPLNKGDIFISGHTHIPHNIDVNGIRCLNPGSLSIPKEESKHSYMIFSEGTFLWKDLSGEIYDCYKLIKE